MPVQSGSEFNAIRISLASPEQIRAWSFGEVTKPETINYRTLRPEKDGLFCERIFGPTKDWECYCGKYKKIRYKGVVCDRCGVEVARAKVRRERMGHIRLAAPVAHIWFSKGTPSRLGLLLDISPRNLERVLYFAQYIVTNVDDEARNRAIEALQDYQGSEASRLDEAAESAKTALQSGEPAASPEGEEVQPPQSAEEGADGEADPLAEQVAEVERQFEAEKAKVEEDVAVKIEELNSLKKMQLLTESRYRELRDRWGEVFTADMGAEAILEILQNTPLEDLRTELQDEVRNTSGQRRKKAIKRLRVVEAFVKSGNRPEWMILQHLPVLPPELRPMVQLDGGRFATSDLNDLYRRVINRNNRLKRLLELHAPEIIVRNEKRMLQESVDALVDNGRRGRAISGSHNHKLKSLTDLLRGKQGRFRQNLLGKRVDYSGRSVIIVGPQLKLHQCGLPKTMALELFKPFVMNALVVRGYAHNIKSAKRMAERARPEVWDILEEVIRNRPVLLNRAPTLHRLGIQAFQPTLVEGRAIQIHPLVCKAFNADFDGDQMAVHVPLSREAVLEAQRLMLSTYNMLAPSSGEPIVSPTLDMVLGNYYLTTTEPVPEDERRAFSDFADARLAHDMNIVGLRQEIEVRNPDTGEKMVTSVGRIILNDVLPDDIEFINDVVDSKAISDIVAEAFTRLGNERTAELLDALKDLGFRYATQSGTTIAINDIAVPSVKSKLLANGDQRIAKLDEMYLSGMIDEKSRYQEAVNTWTGINEELTKAVQEELPNYGGIYAMATSGAKGNIAQIKQMAGMRGLMSDPKGQIIELPIRSSFREGLSVFEYFISTHGARKGLADTALRTADSGYLTRRLADVSQDVIVLFEDCESGNGIWIETGQDDESTIEDRLFTRYPATPVYHPETGELIVDTGTMISRPLARQIVEAGINSVFVRSSLSCEAPRGVCQKCYGGSLATALPVLLGEAVGIVAAQSIGEPGTQLTMRTFHTGGIAGSDITSGLPRVEELFEARQPRGMAVLTEVDGEVEISETSDGRYVTVRNRDQFSEEYEIPSTHKALVKSGEWVDAGTPIIAIKKTASRSNNGGEVAVTEPDEIVSRAAGTANVSKGVVTVTWEEHEERQYAIPAAAHISVENGEHVTAGTALTSGPKSPQDILRIEGAAAAQRYLTLEVLRVYRSQGVAIHEKHIEVIIRQMMRKVRVDTPGSTELLPGELADRVQYEVINNRVLSQGGEPATASPVLLGVTRASLNTDSFLAAASFQETARVLTEAAVNGSVDHLLGLKENVIIGRLIPARLDRSEEGRKKLGLDQLERRSEGSLTGTTEAPPAPPTFEEAVREFGGEELVLAGMGQQEATAEESGAAEPAGDGGGGDGNGHAGGNGGSDEGISRLLQAIANADDEEEDEDLDDADIEDDDEDIEESGDE